MAGIIPGASFVELPGNNHVVLEGTPAFDQFFKEATNFLALPTDNGTGFPPEDRFGSRAVFTAVIGDVC